MDYVEKILTDTEPLFKTDMVGIILLGYLYLIIIFVVAFINIFEVDKTEYLNKVQKCFEFKRKQFYVINYSKNKKIISRKTYILEVAGYLLFLLMLALMIVSFFLDSNISFIVFGINLVLIVIYGSITGQYIRRIRRKYPKTKV